MAMDFLQFNPEVDFKVLLAVPLIPLVGYVINIFLGRRLPRGGDWLLKHPVEWKTPFVYYSLYYATQAMYQLGEAHWEAWREISETLLLEKQNPDGSWSLPPNVHEREAGFAYTTALAILALTVEYRCLPIYQR